MMTRELKVLLSQLRDGISQPKVMLRCDCEVLETVFIHLDESDRVWVTDDRRTFQYLKESGDPTYVLSELDMEAVHRACREIGVTVLEPPLDGYIGIGRQADDELIAPVIAKVAQAMDHVFDFACDARFRQYFDGRE